MIFFLMIRRPPRSTQGVSSAASDVYKRQGSKRFIGGNPVEKIIQSPRDIRDILAVDLVACNNYKNGSEAAKLIELPSMFIFGSLDKMVNLEAGKKFSSLINNSSTHIIEGCGHMIMIEKAFEMRDKDLEFLKK